MFESFDDAPELLEEPFDEFDESLEEFDESPDPFDESDPLLEPELDWPWPDADAGRNGAPTSKMTSCNRGSRISKSRLVPHPSNASKDRRATLSYRGAFIRGQEGDTSPRTRRRSRASSGRARYRDHRVPFSSAERPCR